MGLSVAPVAAARRCVSPRYVQMLFEAEGTTFSRFVRGQRLARAHRLLTDPGHAAWTITAVALESGFGDLPTFNHAFCVLTVHRRPMCGVRRGANLGGSGARQ
jgi:AraC-like DNA-binding protein